MTVKVGINGFGRIGRQVFKAINELHGGELEVVAVNDLFDVKTNAHLFKYDSNYGIYEGTVEVKGNEIVIDGKPVKVFAERNPGDLPWKDLGVEIVIESTGIFRTATGQKGGYKDHIEAGAKKVILTVPAKDQVDRTIVLGVNDDSYESGDVAVSNASCTTNCLAPVAKVLQDNFGIVEGLMTTVHAYTSDQSLHDSPHADLRRARAGAVSIIPTTTGAAAAVGLVIPELNGKLNGMALRVPTPTGSLVDLTVRLEKDPSVEELNAAIKAAADGPMKGYLEYTEDPIVSIDIVQNSHSSIFDSLSTMKIGKGFFKVLSWYDNEWGYSNRVVDLAVKISK